MVNRTLSFEAGNETDGDHATVRKTFSLVQNILLIDYTVLVPADQ